MRRQLCGRTVSMQEPSPSRRSFQALARLVFGGVASAGCFSAVTAGGAPTLSGIRESCCQEAKRWTL